MCCSIQILLHKFGHSYYNHYLLGYTSHCPDIAVQGHRNPILYFGYIMTLIFCNDILMWVKPPCFTCVRQGLPSGNTKGGSVTVPLTSCLNGSDKYVLQIKAKIVSCHTADSKPVKQEVNGTVKLPPFVFPATVNIFHHTLEPFCRLLIFHSRFCSKDLPYY